MQRGEAVRLEDQRYLLDRDGSVQEAFFTLSISPVRLEDGTVGAALVTVEETTSRRQAHEQLLESERRLAVAQQVADMGSWDWEIETGEVRWSRNMYAIYGLDPDRFIPSLPSFRACVHPDDREFLEEKIEEILSTGAAAEFDFRIVKPDGSTRVLMTKGEVTAQSSDGRPRVMTGVNVDVTERRRSETLLHQARCKESYLFALAEALRHMVEPDAIMARAARTLGEHLGADRALYASIVDDQTAVVRTGWTGGLPPLGGEIAIDAAYGQPILSILERGEDLTIEDVATDPRLSPSGRAAFREQGAAAVMAASLVKDGRWVGALVVHAIAPRRWTALERSLVRETAERTWAALELALADAARRESERRFTTLFEESPTPTSLTRVSDRVRVSANKAHLRLFELHPDEGAGERSVDQGLIDEEVAAEARRRFGKDGTLRNFECTARTRSGKPLTILVDMVPVTLGSEAYHLVTIRDVTELRRAEEGARLYEQSKERLLDLDAMERLHRVSARYFDEQGPHAVLDEILDAAIAISQADFGTLQVIDQRSSTLEIVTDRGLPSWWLDQWSQAPNGHGVGAVALQLRERVIVEDVTQDPILEGTEALVMHLRAGIRATQSTPLVGRTGAALGIISTQYREPHRPSPRVLRQLDLLARQAADILDHAAGEAALRRSEAKASTVLEMSADAILSIDESRRIVEWNRGAEAMFGYSRTEALGLDLETLLPERHRTAHGEHVARFSSETATARRMDHGSAVGVRKSGQEFPIAATISNVVIDDERIMTASVRDTTEQTRNEVEQSLLADVGGALSTLDQEAALANVVRLMTDSVSDAAALFVLEEGGSLRRVAASSRDSASARHLSPPSPPPPDHPLWKVIGERGSIIADMDLGSTLMTPLSAGDDCVGALWLASASRRFDERDLRLAEEIGRRCALFIDNARLHATERRATRARDEVLAIVAHDLRSPLSGIIMSSQLFRNPASEPERRAQRAIEKIHHAATHMNRIVEDLLDVARFETGGFEVEPRRLPARALLAHVVEAQRVQVTACSLDLRESTAGEIPDVWADVPRVVRVFENLVGNAMKFTKTGAITIGARALTDEVLFWVADTGVGIAPEHLPHLFDRFWQVRETARDGAGLGLSIVKAIVEAHGGRIWVESQPGAGATFFFTLRSAAGRKARRAADA
jgi:PAS domain S-box-containing protein